MKLISTLIFMILCFIAWLLSILTVLAGEFAILSTSIYINIVICFTLILILFKKNGSN